VKLNAKQTRYANLVPALRPPFGSAQGRPGLDQHHDPRHSLGVGLLTPPIFGPPGLTPPLSAGLRATSRSRSPTKGRRQRMGLPPPLFDRQVSSAIPHDRNSRPAPRTPALPQSARKQPRLHRKTGYFCTFRPQNSPVISPAQARALWARYIVKARNPRIDPRCFRFRCARKPFSGPGGSEGRVWPIILAALLATGNR
jgi:hypothetical protein